MQYLFPILLLEKTEKKLKKSRADTNPSFKNYCKKKIGLIRNENLKENHVGIKKLHLNRKSNSLFAKNFYIYIYIYIYICIYYGIMVSETKLDDSFPEARF